MRHIQPIVILVLTLSPLATRAATISIDVFTVGSVSGTNDFDTFIFNAPLTGTASGLAGNDDFNINTGGSAGLIEGGTGNDTLSLNDGSADAIIVNGADAGMANGSAFTGIENLNGNAGADAFLFSATLSGTASGGAGNDIFSIANGGSAGSIDGGADVDTVSYAGSTGPITTAINQFLNIENLVGSGNAADTLQGTADGNTVTISVADAGDVDGLTFSGFENIAGLGGNDTFNLNAGVSGTVDGGAGDDEIVGAATANTFVVNATDAGAANGSAFANIENLTGGAAADSFTFTAVLSDTASGFGGDDIFYIGDGGNDRQSIDGGTGADEVTYAIRFSGVTVGVNSFANVENLTGSGQSDTLQGTAEADTFTVNAADAGNAGGINFTSFENLDGLGGNDTFILNAGVSGTVNGGAGDDEIVGAVAANTFVVNAASAGTANGSQFANIENLTGGAAADTFILNASLSGMLDGGEGADKFHFGYGSTANILGFDFLDSLIVNDVFGTTPPASAGDDLFLLGFLSFESGNLAYRDSLSDDFLFFASLNQFDSFLISDSLDPFRIVASAVPPVPVPAAIWLFGTALVGFIGISRRRKVA